MKNRHTIRIIGIMTLVTVGLAGCSGFLMNTKNQMLLNHANRFPPGYFKVIEVKITITDGTNRMSEKVFSSSRVVGPGLDGIKYTRSNFINNPNVQFESSNGDKLNISLDKGTLIRSAYIRSRKGDAIRFFGHDPAITSVHQAGELEAKGFISIGKLFSKDNALKNYGFRIVRYDEKVFHLSPSDYEDFVRNCCGINSF